MTAKTTRLTLTVLGLLSAPLALNSSTVLAATIQVPGDFPTIQAAVPPAVPPHSPRPEPVGSGKGPYLSGGAIAGGSSPL